MIALDALRVDSLLSYLIAILPPLSTRSCP